MQQKKTKGEKTQGKPKNKVTSRDALGTDHADANHPDTQLCSAQGTWAFGESPCPELLHSPSRWGHLNFSKPQ